MSTEKVMDRKLPLIIALFLIFMLFTTSIFLCLPPNRLPSPHSNKFLGALLKANRCLLPFILSQALFFGFLKRTGDVFFVPATAVSGFVSMISLSHGIGVDARRFGCNGFISGLIYALICIWNRPLIFNFPILLQHAPFYNFRIWLPSAGLRILWFSTFILSYSWLLNLLGWDENHKAQVGSGKQVDESIIFAACSFVLFLSWELSHYVHRVIEMKKFKLELPRGYAGPETKSTEALLLALEKSAHDNGSPLQSKAYVELCKVCQTNANFSRRAAFFEQTSETYKRIIAICLNPLKQLVSNLSEGCFIENSDPLNNVKLYTWCATSVASLTAKSHTEDKFGVAQLSNSNAAVISTLLSCLLAVEGTATKLTALIVCKDGFLYEKKAYALADVLRSSICCIISEFHSEILASAKAGRIEKDWIIGTIPPFGKSEVLEEKLRLYLDYYYQA